MANPSHIFLNFCNYDMDAASSAEDQINHLADVLGCGGVALRGWGPTPADIEEVRE